MVLAQKSVRTILEGLEGDDDDSEILNLGSTCVSTYMIS